MVTGIALHSRNARHWLQSNFLNIFEKQKAYIVLWWKSRLEITVKEKKAYWKTECMQSDREKQNFDIWMKKRVQTQL